MSEAQVAILTGGAQGLGAAICKLLLDKGYRVCVADIQEEKGKQFVKEQQEKYGEKNVQFFTCDVSKEEDYENLFKFAVEEFKKIDLVINNAGIVLEQNPRKVIEVNLIGPIIGCQMALKYMGKSNGGNGGMVINTASVGGLLPHHATPVYRASKHGVIGLTRSYGTPYHLENDGIMFTAICPTIMDTDMVRNAMGKTLSTDETCMKERLIDLMKPEYVAQGIIKLLEDKINGATLVVTKYGYTYVGYPQSLKNIPIFKNYPTTGQD